jgi:hypothetical protein
MGHSIGVETGSVIPGRLKRIARVLILFVSLGELACQSLNEGARSDFSTSFTCPIERVEVRARPELHPSHWLKARTPPSELASDAGRLRMWQDGQDKLRASVDQYHSIYEARGCGHHALYECGRTTRGSSKSVICREQPYLSDVSPW